jgi:flagellar basal body-associated protein FliL
MAEEREKEESTPPSGWGARLAAKRKGVVLVAGLSVAILLVGVPVVYMLFNSGSEAVEETASKDVVDTLNGEKISAEGALNNDSASEQADEELLDGEELIGAIAPFDTFLVNLSGGKYLRLQLQVEMEERDIPRRFYTRLVPIRDGIITLLTQKSASDLEDVRGKEVLKRAIRDLINEQLKRQDVKRVYFTQFVIQ